MNGSFKSIWLGSTVPRGWRGLVDLSDWAPRAPPIPLHWFPMTTYGFQILLGFLGIYHGRKTGPL